jgi:hypothetical protein
VSSAATRTYARARDSRPEATRGARTAALVGLAARGALYLVLALLSIELVSGSSDRTVDTRGALHQLAHDALGSVVLAVLAVGFACFALWHLFSAWAGGAARQEPTRRLADLGRAVVYGFLCAAAASFLFTSSRAPNSDRTDQSWTAKVLGWSGGLLLVGAVGVAVIGVGLYLVWRAISGESPDEPAVLDAAPRETTSLHVLGAVGNVARGGVVGLIGVFLLGAAVNHDPSESVGLDGALKRLLDNGLGDVAVVFVAIGFAAFGVYSMARAWVNRTQAGTAHSAPS